MAGQQDAISDIYAGVGGVAKAVPGWINTIMGWAGVFVAKYNKLLIFLAFAYLISKSVKIKLGGR